MAEMGSLCFWILIFVFHLGIGLYAVCLLTGFVLPATVLSSRDSKCAAECSVVLGF